MAVCATERFRAAVEDRVHRLYRFVLGTVGTFVHMGDGQRIDRCCYCSFPHFQSRVFPAQSDHWQIHGITLKLN
jgi:hypothetical protein